MLKNLIFLFGFSTFVTIMWIITSVYHNSITSQVARSTQSKAEKIDPKFDLETLDELKARNQIPANLSEPVSVLVEDDDGEVSTTSGVVVSPSPTISTTPLATGSSTTQPEL